MNTYIIPIEPVAQGRPRLSARNGFARAYDPIKSAQYKIAIRGALSRMVTHQPLESSLYIDIEFSFSPPKSWSKKRQISAIKGEIRHTSKPDIDNLAKALLDACNGLLWLDDSQITDAHIRKRYAEKPGITIKLFEVGDG